MDVVEIIAISIMGFLILGWIIGFLILYVIAPKQSIADGFRSWWYDTEDFIADVTDELRGE